MAKTSTLRRSPSSPADHLRSKRLLLRQIATCDGSWTDGRKVYEGRELAALRRQTVNAIIHGRTPKAERPDWGRRPHEWGNLGVLERISRRLPDRPARLAEWMVAIALRSRGTPVGEDRGICVLRLLRRQFPRRALDLARRMTPPSRQTEARMGILKREGAVLSRNVLFHGHVVTKGTPIDDLGAAGGTVLLPLESAAGPYRLAVDVTLADLRAMTPRDRERLAAMEVGRGQLGPAAEDGVPSP